jgi:hypothetical protein
MTVLLLPIPDLPELLAAEYPSIKPDDYNDRDLNRFPSKLQRGQSYLEVWFTLSSGSGSIAWTVIYDPFDDGDARGQTASGVIATTGAGEFYGTGTLLPFTGYPTSQINALKAAQDAAGTYDPLWIRAEYTGPVLTNINIHFQLTPVLRIRKTGRRDGFGYMSATRIGGDYPIERIGGQHP